MPARATRRTAATLLLGLAAGTASADGLRAGGPACRDCGTVLTIDSLPVQPKPDKGAKADKAAHAERTPKPHAATRVYHVSIRMDDGSTRTIRYDNRPALAVGDKVRVTERRVYLR